MFILSHTHTSDSPTRIPLVVGYAPAICSISSIFHKHIYILSSSLRCATFLNIDLSLLSYVLTRWKFAKWTSRLEPELSINVIVLYTVQSPLFFRKITENEC